MIRFTRTEDYGLVREIMTHPAIYPHIADDSCPAVEEFQPTVSPLVIYVLAQDDEGTIGVWVLAQQNAATAEIHTCVLPEARGRRALEAAIELRDWIWANTKVAKLVTNVPTYNRLALRFARCAGMKQFAINTKSFLKNGVLMDQVMLELFRPEVA